MAGHVRIVIVNYRTVDLAIECLRSIAGQIPEHLRLSAVVVDNASADGSVERLTAAIDKEKWRDWASVLPLDRNGGFAYGNNAAVREVLRSFRDVDYVMLLNPDTIVHRGAIRALTDFMDANPGAGIAGSRLESVDGVAEKSAHNSPSPLGELDSGARLGILSRALGRYAVTLPMREIAHVCDWVSGASLIVRREVFEEIGLLDEGYFLYFEEVDFCLRARKAGWKIWFVPESRVVHIEGASTKIRGLAHRRPGYWYDSRRRYFVKHFGILGLILADAFWAMGRVSMTVRRTFGMGSSRNQQDPKCFAFDILWGDVRSILTGKIFRMDRSDEYL